MRKIVLKILNEYEKEKAFINLLLKTELKDDLDSRDKGFITEIVYGVVRNKRFLDYKISKYSKTKVNKLSIPLLNILRIGFYQIYFMDKVPEFAIINESVKLAEKFCYKSKEMVNAILRNGIVKTDENMPIAVRYSFPDQLYNLILEQYGDKTSQILESLNEKKPIVLRVNTLKTTIDEILTYLTDLDYKVFDNYIIINSSFNPSNSEPFQKGLISIQSISSQMAVKVLDPKENEKILDACSAPGGKTVYISELMKNTGEVTACEIYKHRCELIQNNLKRCGITNCKIINEDIRKLAESSEKFDRILIDAPCSGLGVIGGKPDIKWQKFDFDELVLLQKEIIFSCSRNLKDDGTLVYSTCTINKDENINQINSFLQENKNFRLRPFNISIDGVTYGENGYAEILPSKNSIGFFVAKIQKN
jgi:16S rRNA (cytosine967-C5)-methyltransferase